MDAKPFRYFFDYHFSENQILWDSYISKLTHEQFTESSDYSIGSVRDQVIHLMNVDNTWFSGLQGTENHEEVDPTYLDDRKTIRSHWDNVEHDMREYLEKLQDEHLNEKPFKEGEDKDLVLWQVLLHVVNHGTDHRAQILKLINGMGIKTISQDFIFYVYDHLEVTP